MTDRETVLFANEVFYRAFADRDWITPSRSLSCYEMVDRACSLAGFRPRIAAETNDFDVQIELIRSHIGVALIPHLALPDAPAGVTCVESVPTIRRHIHACTRSARVADPGVERLLEVLATATARRLMMHDP